MDRNLLSKKTFWLREAPATIFGVLFLGVVGSTLYDLLVKPGLTTFGRLLINVVTLGSRTLQDAAYSTAALDPGPVAGVIILQAGLALAAFPAVKLFNRQRGRNEFAELREELDRAGERRQEVAREQLVVIEKKIRKVKRAFFIVFIPWWLGLAIALLVYNQSVIVWRAFHANVAILQPYISVDEASRLRADFASMESRSDYERLKQRMRAFAQSHGLKLRDIDTW